MQFWVSLVKETITKKISRIQPSLSCVVLFWWGREESALLTSVLNWLPVLFMVPCSWWLLLLLTDEELHPVFHTCFVGIMITPLSTLNPSSCNPWPSFVMQPNHGNTVAAEIVSGEMCDASNKKHSKGMDKLILFKDKLLVRSLENINLKNPFCSLRKKKFGIP